MGLPLFHRAYGQALQRIPRAIVHIHDIGEGKTWQGEAAIAMGTSFLAKAIGTIAGFPPPADAVPVTVEMTPAGDGEIWRRKFGACPFNTQVRAGKLPGTIEETLGVVTAVLRLVPDDTGVQQIPEGYRLFGIPLPRMVWPELDVRESAEGDRYRFKVAMRLWGVPIQRYEGWLDATGAA
jgi:uncharacterized protein DUF4166